MNIEQIVITALSSSLIGGVVGTYVAGHFNLKAKDREYENEYYKLVLAKRVAAYEEIQQLITGLKTAVLDDDKQPYHIIFSSDESLQDTYRTLLKISSQAAWISDDLFMQTRDIGRLLFGASSHKEGIIAFGKKKYEELAGFRETIEKLQIRDMLTLHKIRNFLESKKVPTGFSEIRL